MAVIPPSETNTPPPPKETSKQEQQQQQQKQAPTLPHLLRMKKVCIALGIISAPLTFSYAQLGKF